MKIITTNDSKIKGKRKELEHYNGCLPQKISIILGAKSYEKHTEYIKEKGIYEEWLHQFMRSRKYSSEEANEELVNWVKENPQYSNFIKYVDKPSEKDLEETKKILGWI